MSIETKIADMLRKGKTYKQIAAKLKVATVRIGAVATGKEVKRYGSGYRQDSFIMNAY